MPLPLPRIEPRVYLKCLDPAPCEANLYGNKGCKYSDWVLLSEPEVLHFGRAGQANVFSIQNKTQASQIPYPFYHFCFYRENSQNSAYRLTSIGPSLRSKCLNRTCDPIRIWDFRGPSLGLEVFAAAKEDREKGTEMCWWSPSKMTPGWPPEDRVSDFC